MYSWKMYRFGKMNTDLQTTIFYIQYNLSKWIDSIKYNLVGKIYQESRKIKYNIMEKNPPIALIDKFTLNYWMLD